MSRGSIGARAGEPVATNADESEGTELQWVARCKDGDDSAWNPLFARWNNRLLFYLRRLVTDDQAARGLLQEVWVKAIKNIGSLRDNAAFAPWIYRIARNAAISHLRQKHQQSDRHEPGDAERLIDDDIPDNIRMENTEIVHFALQEIGLAEREILTLYFLKDLTTAEIANLLEIPAGTVKSRLHKARGALRRVIEREVD